MISQTRLDRFEHRTEWPLAAVAMAFLALYSVQVLAAPGGRGGVVLGATLAALYFVFIADYLARLYLADSRSNWFVRHLFDLVIVVLPFLRPLRLLSLVVVITALQRAVGHDYKPLLEHPDILVMAWGATVPMIAHAAGIMLDEITTTWAKWVTPTERKTAKGVIAPGNVAAVRFTINGVYKGETRIQLEHVNRIGADAAPDWPSGNENDVYRVDIEGTPSQRSFAGMGHCARSTTDSWRGHHSLSNTNPVKRE